MFLNEPGDKVLTYSTPFNLARMQMPAEGAALFYLPQEGVCSAFRNVIIFTAIPTDPLHEKSFLIVPAICSSV